MGQKGNQNLWLRTYDSSRVSALYDQVSALTLSPSLVLGTTAVLVLIRNSHRKIYLSVTYPKMKGRLQGFKGEKRLFMTPIHINQRQKQTIPISYFNAFVYLGV